MGYWMQRLADSFLGKTTTGVQVVEDSEKATHILFLETGDYTRPLWKKNPLGEHELRRKFPHKCYIWSYEDHPSTYLPGLYTSMPRAWFDPRLHRAFRYPYLHAERLPVPDEKERDILYSFVGAPTAALRREIFALPKHPSALVREAPNYNSVNHAPEQAVMDYADILARSRFTLCPAGAATSSFRFFEALRAGSVPVIISDELVLPEGPDWTKCSVRVAENDIPRIPQMLESIADPEAMSRAAKRAHGDFFSLECILDHLARELVALGPADESLARRRYRNEQAGKLWGRIKNRIVPAQ